MTEKEENKKNFTKLMFQCEACNKVFDEPGMCIECDIVLKAKAA
jgi:rRNA maturation endonuclease Nob1